MNAVLIKILIVLILKIMFLINQQEFNLAFFRSVSCSCTLFKFESLTP